jgi:aminoglycoside phosphotransferase (APT) family kinase protein
LLNRENLSDATITELKEQILQNAYFTSDPDKLEIEQLGLLTDNWEVSMYNINILSEGESYGLVLRVDKGDVNKQKTGDQFQSLTRLHTLKLPLPKPYIFGFFDSIKSPFILMERIEGKTMGNVMQTAENEKIENYLKQFIQGFVHLHKLDWTEVMSEEIIYNIKEYPHTYIGKKLEEYAELIHKHNFQELMPLLEILQDNIDDGASDKLSVIHNDFHPFNVLIDQEDKLKIIDWSLLEIGDHRADLGWTLMLIRTATNEDLRDLILELYEEYFDQTIQNIEYFELLAALRRLYEVSKLLFVEDELLPHEAAVAIVQEMRLMIINTMIYVNDVTDLEFPKLEDELIFEEELEDDTYEE